jgi:hypothetical protein
VTAAEGWLYDDLEERWTRLSRPEGGPTEPGPATWLDDTLVVYGGEQWDPGTAGISGSDSGSGSGPGSGSDPLSQADVYSTDAWAFHLPD